MRVTAKDKETGLKRALRARGYLPATEVATRTGFSSQHIYDLADGGKVKQVRIGKARWVEWASMLSYLRAANPDIAKLVGSL